VQVPQSARQAIDVALDVGGSKPLIHHQTDPCGLPKLHPESGRADRRRASDSGMSFVLALLAALRAALKSRADLALENLALRQQLALLQRRAKQPRFGPIDRLLWIWLSMRWDRWREALHIIRPETVIRWHRQGFRAFWTWKSRRGQLGRPRVASDLAELVRAMGAGQSPLGCTSHPRRVAQARPRCVPAHRCATDATPT